MLLSPQVHHGVGKRKTVVQRFHLFGAGTDAVKNTGIQLNQQVQHSVWGRGGVRARQATDKIAHVRVRCQYVRRTRHHKHQNKSQVVQALVRRHESSDAPVDYPLAAIATRGILADVQRRPSMHHLLQNGGFPLRRVLKVLDGVADHSLLHVQGSCYAQSSTQATPAEQVSFSTLILAINLKEGPGYRADFAAAGKVIMGHPRKRHIRTRKLVRTSQ